MVKKSEKNRGLIKRVENGGILSIICHHLPWRWSIGTYQWKSMAIMPPSATNIFCHRFPVLMKNSGKFSTICHDGGVLEHIAGKWWHYMPPFAIKIEQAFLPSFARADGKWWQLFSSIATMMENGGIWWLVSGKWWNLVAFLPHQPLVALYTQKNYSSIVKPFWVQYMLQKCH